MIIKLSPQRSDDNLTVNKIGDVLTINKEVFDFSAIPEGATLPSEAVGSEWITSDVERINGELEFTLRMPIEVNASYEKRFPEPLVNVQDGVVL